MNSMPSTQSFPEFPCSDLELFSDASLRDPYPDYQVLRDLGPVVKLRKPDVYAIGRFREVHDALRAAEVLRSGEGVGFSETFNSQRGANVLQADGELHRRLRSAILAPLKPAQLDKARPHLKSMIGGRIGQLLDAGEFDAMSQLANCLPLEAVAHLVGLAEDGREQMLEWAAASFNCIGPKQDPLDLERLMTARAYILSLDETRVRTDSWSGHLFDAARNGRLSNAEAIAAISAYVFPSLDTTILAKGHLLLNLARNPDQWRLLQKRPEFIPAAVLEGLRHSSVVRWFSRVASQDYRMEGHVIPAGGRVMLLYGCANRDERHYSEPDKFEIARDSRDHLAFGKGPHQCAGMYLARLEMEVMLEELVERVSILRAGSPIVSINQGLYGFRELPFCLER